MKSKSILRLAFLCLFSGVLVVPNAAYGVYGGKASNDNPFVVGILQGERHTASGCSGALIAPRVVFTAAHCLTGSANSVWIPTPGSDLTNLNSKRVQAEKFFIPSGFTTAKFPYDNDFGVIVLKEGHTQSTPLSIATSDDVLRWSQENAAVLHVGYGCTTLVDAPPCGKTSPVPNEIETTLITSLPDQFKSLTPGTFSMTKISVEKTICGGDSGSPLLKKDGDKWIYIGAQSSSNGAGCTKSCNIVCVATQGLPSSNVALVQEAFDYVKATTPAPKVESIPTPAPKVESTPSPTPTLAKPLAVKSTINCVKGKAIKKVTAISPKCPKGYTKR